MSEISQRLGFDAAQALQSITEVNTRLSTLTQTLDKFTGALRRTNRATATFSKNMAAVNNLGAAANALNNLSSATNNYTRNVQNNIQINNNFNNSLNTVNNTLNNATNNLNQAGQAAQRASRATGGFTITWETLVRVIQTQVIVRAWASITREIREGVQAAIDFQKQVALIGTISGGSLGGLDEIGARALAVSNALGVPLEQVTEGAYLTLSNQVGAASDAFNTLGSAQRLAIATGSDLDETVNLLSSAINSFNLEASQADDAASVFFKTIELGRVRASELGDIFGRVSPIAAQLGLDLRETASAIAAITQSGVRTDTAVTQLRAVLIKLIKPTDDLRAVFADLGVETGEQALQRFGGLQGLLGELAERADGNTEAFGGFFSNVRAIAGALDLATNRADAANNVLDQMNETTSDLAQQRFNLVFETDAQQVTRELTRLQNIFIQFGNDSLPTLLVALRALNNTLEFLNNNARAVSTTLALLTGTWIAYRTAGIAIAAQNTAIGASFIAMAPAIATIGIVLAGATAAFIAFQFIASRGIVQAQAAQEALAKLSQEQLSEYSIYNSAQISDEQRKIRQLTEINREGFNTLNDIYRENVKNAREANSQIVVQNEVLLDGLVSSYQAYYNQLETIERNARKNIADSASRSNQIRDQIEEDSFRNQLRRFDEIGKATRILQRASDLSREGSVLLATAGQAGSPEQVQAQIDRALDILEQAKTLNDEAAGIGESTNNRAIIYRTDQAILSTRQAQLRAEEQLREIEQTRAEAANRQKAESEAQLKTIQNLVGEAQKLTSAFDSQGNILSQDQIAANRAQLQDVLRQLQGQELLGDNLNLANILGLSNLANQFNQQLEGVTATVQLNADNSIVDITQRLRTAMQDIPVELQIQAGEVLGEDPSGQLSQFQRAISAAEDQANEQNRLREAFNNNLQKSANLQATLNTLVSQYNLDVTKGFAINEQEREGVLQLAKELASQPFVSSEGIEELEQRIASIQDRIFGDEDEFLGGTSRGLAEGVLGIPQGEIQRFIGFVETLRDLRSQQIETQGIGFDEGELSRAQEFLNNTRPVAEQLKNSLNTSNQNASNLNTTLGGTNGTLQVAVERTSSIASNLAAAARSAAQIDVNPPGAAQPAQFGKVIQRAFGGSINYRANGGFARGTDNVLTALSAGERVTNARSSAQFASQLISMNAGIRPTFREEGGSVNNFSVGDIHINEAQGPKQTARTVVQELKREFRRGSSKL